MDLPAPVSCPGLLAAWRLRPDEPPSELDPNAAAAALDAHEAGLWLHFNLIDQRSKHLIAELPIPAPAAMALLEPDDSPHLESSEGAVYGAIADFVYEAPDGRVAETSLLHVALTPDLLVTARRHPLRIAHRVSRAPSGNRPEDVFAQILRETANAMNQSVQLLTTHLARLEERLLRHGESHTDRQALGELRRAALRLERVFAPTAETLAEWCEDPSDSPAEPSGTWLAREERRHASVRRNLDALQDRAHIAQDELAGLAAEETNRRLYVLSVISAVMLPATMISGIFGMNVGSVPGVEKEWGFAMVMGLIAGSVLLVLAALRRWKLL